MATSVLFHLVHVLLILGTSCSKIVSEDLSEAARQDSDIPGATEHLSSAHVSTDRDMVSINMFKIYEKYSKEPSRQKDGNTVRSFKAVPGE